MREWARAVLASRTLNLMPEMGRVDNPWRLWNQPDDGLAPPDPGKVKKAKP